MASLLELSHELLHCIFLEIQPADLSALSRTCKDLNGYIRGNRLLHKDLYIRRYDQPGDEDRVDWEEEIHNFVKLEKLLDSSNRENKQSSLDFVASQMHHLLASTAPDPNKSRNIELLANHFKDRSNIDAFLCASGLFARAGGENQQPASTEELRQASASLHCMFGVPVDNIPSPDPTSFSPSPSPPSSSTRLRTRPYLTHTYARSKVYDLRQYTDDTLWGPFRNDGSHRVDWEKVEAIMVVLGFNLRKFTERSEGRFPQIWDKPFVGATPRSYISPPPAPGPSEKDADEEMLQIRDLALGLDAMDPYGVSGVWMRVVCFLDYNDLYAFNFGPRIGDAEPREPIDTEEAIRLIRVKWQVIKIEPPGLRNRDDDRDDDSYSDGSYNDDDRLDNQEALDWSGFRGERLPVVHFAGTSRSLHASWDPNANSKIRGESPVSSRSNLILIVWRLKTDMERGTVRQTPEGEIRWTTFSIFHGEERWRSEGIQVGGLRSARGVLGNWFDKDYDMHGPAGPTAFWKETDELEEDRSSSWLDW